MIYRRTGRSGLLLPALSVGLWQRFGGDAPSDENRAILRRAFELGVTHFDLANNYGPPYGSAESNFGRILRTDLAGHRDELVISTKAGWDMWPGPYGDWGSRKYLLASLDQSLKRMGLEYVDIFYHHRPDPETPLEETMGALATAVHQGKALYVGISQYQPEATREAVAILKSMGIHLLIHQPGYSLLPDTVNQNMERVRALAELAKRRGQKLSQMALAWVLRDPRVTSSIVGVSSVQQLEENLGALDNLNFAREELEEIDRNTR